MSPLAPKDEFTIGERSFRSRLIVGTGKYKDFDQTRKAIDASGAQIVTVEGLAHDTQLNALQQAFVEEGGVQCGFCTPGMLISAHALLNRNPNPSEAEIRKALLGNLCRCTGYVRIVKAVQKAARDPKGFGNL